jgi:hypothetical protein
MSPYQRAEGRQIGIEVSTARGGDFAERNAKWYMGCLGCEESVLCYAGSCLPRNSFDPRGTLALFSLLPRRRRSCRTGRRIPRLSSLSIPRRDLGNVSASVNICLVPFNCGSYSLVKICKSNLIAYARRIRNVENNSKAT